MEDFNFVLFISNDILTLNPKDVIFTKENTLNKYFQFTLRLKIIRFSSQFSKNQLHKD